MEDYQKIEMDQEYDVASFKSKQVFGTSEGSQMVDEDLITCLRFDPTGNYLCLGDSEGRVIIFNKSTENNGEFEYCAEFQSHYRKFDLLNSREIMENIVDICWMNPQGKYLKMLTTNTKSIRFWKCSERIDKKLIKAPGRDHVIPKLEKESSSFQAIELKCFPCLHESNIGSISKTNNEQYLLSNDETRCLFWNIQKSSKPYISYDISDKKKYMSHLALTCSKMHPSSDSIFLTGMNQNNISLGDLRQSSIQLSNTEQTGNILDFGVEIHSMKNFFTDMVSSISQAEFIQNGKYIVSRQYLNVKVWDITQTRKPVLNICTKNGLKGKLAELFEKNNIYDKFSISSSPDNSMIVTGSYNNNFHLINLSTSQNYQYTPCFNNTTIKEKIPDGKGQVRELDAYHRISSAVFDPSGKTIAVSSLNSFFIYGI